MPFTYVSRTFDEQVLRAVALVRERRFALAAAAVVTLEHAAIRKPSERVHAMPLRECLGLIVHDLDAGDQQRALVALDSLRRLYGDEPSRFLHVIDGGREASSSQPRARHLLGVVR